MSTLVERGEVIDCSNPKLDLFITLSGVLTNPFDLEFAIFDIADPMNPVQTFPVAGFQSVDPGNDCPVGQRLSTGRFTAVWTVPLTEPLTNHKITWRFRLNSGDPQQEFEQPFDVVTIAGASDPVDVTAFRTRFPDFADPAQWPASLLTEIFNEAACLIDPTCFGATKLAIATQYLVAHLASYATQGGRAGGAQSVSAGMASINWGAGANDLSATAYGQRYQKLARVHCGGPMVLC